VGGSGEGGGGGGMGSIMGQKVFTEGPVGAWLLGRFSLREIQILKKPKLVQVPTVDREIPPLYLLCLDFILTFRY
jgi:hypothetical protein